MLTPSLQKILERVRKNTVGPPSSSPYPEELKQFAVTLQFFSTKAYEFVRKTFLKALPHVATVRKWFSRIRGGPGFSEEALELLQKHVKVSGPQKELIVALTVDEMKIKKQFEFDDKTSQFIGYSDIGSGDFYKLPVNLFFSILRIYELSSSHFIDAYLLPNS